MCKNPCKTRRLFRVRHPPPKDKSWTDKNYISGKKTRFSAVFFCCGKEIL